MSGPPSPATSSSRHRHATVNATTTPLTRVSLARAAEWTAKSCCWIPVRPDERTCWSHGDGGEGWRDPGNDSGGKQCPVGSFARPSWDHHGRGLEVEWYTEEECCRRTCYSSGWRDFGDGAKACPEHHRAREKHDDHQPDKDDFSVEECCTQVSRAASLPRHHITDPDPEAAR